MTFHRFFDATKNFQEVFDEYYLKILVVSEITIDDAYLNKGYEIKAIIDLISLCRILEIDYIIVKPFPDVMNKFKHEEKKKNKKIWPNWLFCAISWYLTSIFWTSRSRLLFWISVIMIYKLF